MKKLRFFVKLIFTIYRKIKSNCIGYIAYYDWACCILGKPDYENGSADPKPLPVQSFPFSVHCFPWECLFEIAVTGMLWWWLQLNALFSGWWSGVCVAEYFDLFQRKCADLWVSASKGMWFPNLFVDRCSKIVTDLLINLLYLFDSHYAALGYRYRSARNRNSRI
jgi:hypothetical protein